jgi:hypothetical protein
VDSQGRAVTPGRVSQADFSENEFEFVVTTSVVQANKND